MPEQPVALVTGANRGIGREIMRLLAERGFHGILTARDPRQGVPAARELGIEFSPLDVCDALSIQRLAERLTLRKVEVAVVVHNAGVMFREFSLEVARATLAVNFYGVLHVQTALAPLLAANARVVVVSSGLGDRSKLGPALAQRFADGVPDEAAVEALMAEYLADVEAGVHVAKGWPSSAYAVSKIGATMLAQVWGRGFANDGRQILCNAMCPGWVQTAMGGEGADRTPEEGADTAVWLATQGPDGPQGGFFRDRQPASW